MHRSFSQIYRVARGRSSLLAPKNSNFSGSSSQLLKALGASTSSPQNTADIWTPLQLRSKSTAASAAYDQSVSSFPSIVIGPNGSIVPQGSFAEAQAEVRNRQEKRKGIDATGF